MKKIFLLGATGSVGQNTLKVIAENKDLFSLITMSTSSFLLLLALKVLKAPLQQPKLEKLFC